jgi:hypothetical protein
MTEQRRPAGIVSAMMWEQVAPFYFRFGSQAEVTACQNNVWITPRSGLPRRPGVMSSPRVQPIPSPSIERMRRRPLGAIAVSVAAPQSWGRRPWRRFARGRHRRQWDRLGTRRWFARGFIRWSRNPRHVQLFKSGCTIRQMGINCCGFATCDIN